MLLSMVAALLAAAVATQQAQADPCQSPGTCMPPSAAKSVALAQRLATSFLFPLCCSADNPADTLQSYRWQHGCNGATQAATVVR